MRDLARDNFSIFHSDGETNIQPGLSGEQKALCRFHCGFEPARMALKCALMTHSSNSSRGGCSLERKGFREVVRNKLCRGKECTLCARSWPVEQQLWELDLATQECQRSMPLSLSGSLWTSLLRELLIASERREKRPFWLLEGPKCGGERETSANEDLYSDKKPQFGL